MKVTAGNRSHFAANLRTLCASVNSVSQVCRHVRFNRQQFARYLNGQFLPSLRNVRRICDYFGVAPEDVFLPPGDFAALWMNRHPAASQEGSVQPAQPLPREAVAGARRYLGYWFRYLRAAERTDAIVKAAVRVFEDEGRVLCESLERLRDEQLRCRGSLMLLVDRLFIVEWNALPCDTITETILYPTHKHPMSLVYGERFGVTRGAAREPRMTPIVYEFAGAQRSPRALLRQCRLYPAADGALDDRIVTFVMRSCDEARIIRRAH
jgi:hypothetical protein